MAEARRRSWAAGPSGSPGDLNHTGDSELTQYSVHEQVRVRGERSAVRFLTGFLGGGLAGWRFEGVSCALTPARRVDVRMI